MGFGTQAMIPKLELLVRTITEYRWLIGTDDIGPAADLIRDGLAGSYGTYEGPVIEATPAGKAFAVALGLVEIDDQGMYRRK